MFLGRLLCGEGRACIFTFFLPVDFSDFHELRKKRERSELFSSKPVNHCVFHDTCQSRAPLKSIE